MEVKAKWAGKDVGHYLFLLYSIHRRLHIYVRRILPLFRANFSEGAGGVRELTGSLHAGPSLSTLHRLSEPYSLIHFLLGRR